MAAQDSGSVVVGAGSGARRVSEEGVVGIRAERESDVESGGGDVRRR